MINGIAMQFRRKVLYYRSPLEPLRQRVLDRDILGVEAYVVSHGGTVNDDTVYGPGNVMVVWLAHLLARLPFVNETQWRLLLNASYGNISVAGDNIARAVNPVFSGKAADGKLRNYQFAFVDGRYATWTDMAQKGFMDITTGDQVAELQYPGLESLSYNLTELARRNLVRFLTIEQKMESADAGTD